MAYDSIYDMKATGGKVMHRPVQEAKARMLRSALLMLASVAFWLLFTWTSRPHELFIGTICALLSGVYLGGVLLEELQHFRFRVADVGTFWRIPWYVLSSSWELVVVLFRDLLGIETAPSLYRVCGFRTSKEDPEMVARRALATAYTSVAPNFIVVGIDYSQSRMLFHQVRRSEVPRMTQALGALVSHETRRHGSHLKERT